jgi:hypothetical protein
MEGLLCSKFHFAKEFSMTSLRQRMTDGYFAGIRFSEDTEWSGDQIVPKHMISLEILTH